MKPVTFTLSAFVSFAFSAQHQVKLGVEDTIEHECHRTQVAILGAGISGITAAQALSNHSIHDFIIVERNDYIGGRARNTQFGKHADGKPYTIELGANWVQGLQTPLIENPIWTLVKKYNITTVPWTGFNATTFDETGEADYRDYFFDIRNASIKAASLAQTLKQDTSIRAGVRYAGWDPSDNHQKAAIDWTALAWEQAAYPSQTSLKGTYGPWPRQIGTYGIFDRVNRFVTDQRGLNFFIVKEAEQFLTENDPRLQLNTIVTNISYSSTGVTIHTSNKTCIQAEHAIVTFSLGVLQHRTRSTSTSHARSLTFHPPLPQRKQLAIDLNQFQTYTKIFLSFPHTFWPTNVDVLLYADPTRYGHYPAFQPLPFHNVLMATIVSPLSHTIENQPIDQTRSEIMAVLRNMFPTKNIPEPDEILIPKWGQWEWVRGSYSGWPVGYDLDLYRNLQENVEGRLWFAGEAGSEYPGYMHGAWFSGRRVGEEVAMRVLEEEKKSVAD